MKEPLEVLFIVAVRDRLGSKYFIPSELRSAHVLLYPSIQKMACHTQFCNLITSPPFATLPLPSSVAPSAPEQVLSSLLSDPAATVLWWDPQSRMSLGGEAAIPDGGKRQCFQTMSSRQHKYCKWTKSLQTDNLQGGKENT